MADGADLSNIRNIGIMAHIDAGKTTTSERILYYTHKVHRMGEVDKGTATLDWMNQEQERGITITSAATSCFWNGFLINLIDTPGHVDFTVEVERSLRVLDGAIAVFCAVGGVQPQSETVWRQADKYLVPRIAYINKMDRIGADFLKVLNMINTNLGNRAVAIQLPIGKEENFTGIIDIVELKAYEYQDDKGEKILERNLNKAELALASYHRELMIEKLAETDDFILEKFIESAPISAQTIKRSLRQQTILNKIVPVLCGSSYKNKGVQKLLDAVVDYLPSPLEVPAVEGITPLDGKTYKVKTENKAPLCALVFKIAIDPFVGKISYLRIFSGQMSEGTSVWNSSRNHAERISKILKMHANHREEVKLAGAGDIVAVVGLKNSFTGDTICSKDLSVVLESIKFPEPVIDVSIEPKSRADEEKLDDTLNRLVEEDPTFHVRIDKESGQRILSGMGELHLEVIIDRLLNEFNVNANIGKPQVAYKESVAASAKAEGVFDRIIAGQNSFASVRIRISPAAEGTGTNIICKISAEEIPLNLIKAAESGIIEALQAGVLAGYPIDDVKIELLGGNYREDSSTVQSFKVAASIALREALKKAEPILLEPIMQINVISPTEYLGEVISDLNSRRGQVESIEEDRDARAVKGVIPLAETFGYATNLRSISQGRASFTLQPKNYAPVPESKTKAIMAKRYGLPI